MSDEYNEDLIIAKRNITALHEMLKHHERRQNEIIEQVHHLQTAVTDLTAMVRGLTLQMGLLRAKALGTGATNHGD